MSHILIAGLGDLGTGLAEQFLAEGHRVSAIRRGSHCPSGVELYSQDLLAGAAMLPPDPVDLVIIIMTPSEFSEEGYLKAYVRAPQTLLDALAAQQQIPGVGRGDDAHELHGHGHQRPGDEGRLVDGADVGADGLVER